MSVAVLEVDMPGRMGLETLEITTQRIVDGCSPAYNFGRMPCGWVRSSGNTKKLDASHMATFSGRPTAQSRRPA